MKNNVEKEVVIVDLENCKKCTHHMDSMTDSVLCRYYVEVEYRVLDKSSKKGYVYVVGCPLSGKKKK